MNERSRLPLVLRVLIACATLAAIGTATAAAERRVQFDISPQDLLTALNEFARQSDQELLFSTDVAASKRTGGVTGEFPPTEALRALLEGTGLGYRVTSANTILIERTGNDGTDRGAEKTSLIFRTPLIIAQAAPVSQHAQQDTRDDEESAQATNGARDETHLGKMTVTGSHIRGAETAGSKVIVVDREDIDESGYVTVQDVLKTLPQNFGDAIGEDFTAQLNAGNFNNGTSVNLRGLGAGSTLVLVNGRRQVAGGINGAFVDVSSIASTAVERIEVLTDGASAIYGSDAIAGVVNVILRRDYDGAETRARKGTLGGDADETQLSQLFGTNWATGHALGGYQYHKREALPSVDREYSADTDQRRFGGSNFSSFRGSPGNILDPITRQPVFAIPDGQDGRSLTASDLLPGVVNFQNGAEAVDILGEQQMHSAFLNASQRLGELFEIFLEGRYSTRETVQRHGGVVSGASLVVPASNPFFVDPFGGSSSVRVAYNFLNDAGPFTGAGETETYNGTLGAITSLPHEWRASLAGSYGEEKTRWQGRNMIVGGSTRAALLADPNPATALNPFGDGGDNNPATIDAMRAPNQTEGADADIWTANLIADGPVFDLPGGAARFAIGADFRDEGLLTRVFTGAGVGFESLPRMGREVTAAFAELALPVVGSEHARPALQRLDVSLAARYEDYSDFGNTLNPRVGLSWQPLEPLKVRGTWGTSFRAPNLIELSETPFSNADLLLPLVDAQSTSGQSIVLSRFGNNASLEEETATTWSAGFDFTPPAVQDLVLSLTYYEVDYKDRVAAGGPTGNQLGILLAEDEWATLITRNPSQSEVAAICNGPLFLGAPSDCTTTPPVAIVDFRLRNLAVVNVRGVDLDVEHSLETARGTFGFGLNGTYVLNFERAVSDASPLVDVVDTRHNPLSLRLRGMLSWGHRGWEANAFVNHSNAYDDTISQPNRTVDSWTTLDLHLSYRIADGAGGLDNTQLALNVVNVFDEDPPFVNAPTGYDGANADPLGRVISAQIVKAW